MILSNDFKEAIEIECYENNVYIGGIVFALLSFIILLIIGLIHIPPIYKFLNLGVAWSSTIPLVTGIIFVLSISLASLCPYKVYKELKQP